MIRCRPFRRLRLLARQCEGCAVLALSDPSSFSSDFAAWYADRAEQIARNWYLLERQPTVQLDAFADASPLFPGSLS